MQKKKRGGGGIPEKKQTNKLVQMQNTNKAIKTDKSEDY